MSETEALEKVIRLKTSFERFVVIAHPQLGTVNLLKKR
jgi:hypothetical protein